jgi:ferredoxin
VIRIGVDRERCVGSGTCEMLAADLFEVGGDGIVAVLRPELDGDDVDAAEDAVQACPTQALSVVD